MLDPETRSLYTASLSPPPGFAIDVAIATTYSLDPLTLLTIPAHLALLAEGQRVPDPVALLESLRRVAARTTIFAQRGRLHVPPGEHKLFGLLEPMIIEARAPGGGAFHPKIWLLRYAPARGHGGPLIRLLVLSRNLTEDRSWDVSVQLDGTPGAVPLPANEPLVMLLRVLPAMAIGPISNDRLRQIETMIAEIACVAWEPPPGFQSVQFHAMGVGGPSLALPPSDELAVISPFIDPAALGWLASTTRRFRALVGRAEELDPWAGALPRAIESIFTLEDAAAVEDGEETLAQDRHGLHAKVYLLRAGTTMHLLLGSANATSPGLRSGANVELLAHLSGPVASPGPIDALLDAEGFGALLVGYKAPPAPPSIDPCEQAAEDAIDAARDALGAAALRITCEVDGDAIELMLAAPAPVPLPGIKELRAWPITLPEQRAADALPLAAGRAVALPRSSLASVTCLIGFEARAEEAPRSARFTLVVPFDAEPPGREAALYRAVLNDRSSFLRYLLLLLGDPALEGEAPGGAPSGGIALPWAFAAGGEEILERLVRAFSREPARLAEIRDVIDRLRDADDKAVDVIPPEFLDLWRVFEAALSRHTQEVRR